MLNKTFEWLRVADLSPDDKMVTARTSAARDLLSRIRSAGTYGLLIDCVSGTIGGFELLNGRGESIHAVLDCIRSYQPAFPASLTENALHLRICCAISLGELLTSATDDTKSESLLAASLFTAGIGGRPPEIGRHLASVLDELGSCARAHLHHKAVADREPPELAWDDFQGLSAHIGDPAAFFRKLLPAVKDLIETAVERSDSGREELEVMWWLYNGFSERLGKAIKAANVMQAAAAIGREVAERVAPPATAGLRELVSQAAAKDRKAAEVKGKSIPKIVTDLDQQGRKMLAPASEHTTHLARVAAPALPLSWLALRLEDSGGSGGWEAEFRAKTGISAEQEMTPSQVAAQAFEECQALRLYESLVRK